MQKFLIPTGMALFTLGVWMASGDTGFALIVLGALIGVAGLILWCRDVVDE